MLIIGGAAIPGVQQMIADFHRRGVRVLFPMMMWDQAREILTWGQYSYPFVTMVDKYKWLEPRHMVNISDRWKRDKTDNLQFAFFNGVGWGSWENIWGIWNGITPRVLKVLGF